MKLIEKEGGRAIAYTVDMSNRYNRERCFLAENVQYLAFPPRRPAAHMTMDAKKKILKSKILC